MDLKQLEYFVRVAEMGSFTRAAGLLNVAQPALSRQIRLLEVELRQHLLLRNGRGVSVTEAGKVLLDHGRGILHQVERAREDLSRVGGTLAGRVTLGLPPSIAKMLTVPLTRAFRAQLPQASLSISEGLTFSMQEGLRTGRLDIALLYNPAPSPEIDTVPLMDEALFLISSMPRAGAAMSQPCTRLKDVAALELIMPSRPNALRMLVETQMAAIGCKPIICLEIDGISAILDLVADGAGHAILPGHALAGASKPENYLAQAIVEPALGSKLTLATASARTTTLTQQAMLGVIREVTGQVFGTQTG